MTKENFTDADLVDATGEYFQSAAFSDDSEFKNDQLQIVAENLKSNGFKPTSKIGVIAWQFVNAEPVTEEWDDAYFQLAEIFEVTED